MNIVTKSLAAAILMTNAIAPAFAQDGFVWTHGTIPGDSLADSLFYVSYGIPETDAVQVQARCVLGNGQAPAQIVAEFGADIGARGEGSTDQLRYIDGSAAHGFVPVRIVGTTREEGITGVEITGELEHPFWQMLQTGGLLSYGLPGQELASVSLAGAAEPLNILLAQCFQASLAETAAPAPALFVTCANIFGMASQNGDVPQRVTFTNGSVLRHSLFWMGYNGQPVHFGDMEPGQSITMDTYLTHPWMITDGPGNCLDAMLPAAGQSQFTSTATGRNIGNE